jgi:hypothetical protein
MTCKVRNALFEGKEEENYQHLKETEGKLKFIMVYPYWQ